MKEEDIRPSYLHEEYLRLSKNDARKFFSDDSRWQVLPCPACDSENVEYCFNKDGFRYSQCSDCRTLYQSPRPSIEEFEAFYVDSPSSNYWAEVFFPKIAEARRELIFRPRVKQITEYCKEKNLSHNTIIDVGAGFGIFLDEWRYQHPIDFLYAIEPGMKLAQACRNKEIETLEVLAEHAKTWTEKGDLITCFEVIEHVHSPIDFIKSLRTLTKPGGHVLVSGLGVDGYDIQVLWNESKSISPPHHINFMSVRGFELLFERAGFEDVDVLTPGKLDVEIVKKALDANPELANQNRFAELISKSSEQVQVEFQTFLQNNRMSSHVWVFAKRPEK